MESNGVLKCDYCGSEISQERRKTRKYKKHLNGKVECIECFIKGEHRKDYSDERKVSHLET